MQLQSINTISVPLSTPVIAGALKGVAKLPGNSPAKLKLKNIYLNFCRQNDTECFMWFTLLPKTDIG